MGNGIINPDRHFFPDVLKRPSPLEGYGDHELQVAREAGGSAGDVAAKAAMNNVIALNLDVANFGAAVGNVAVGVHQVGKSLLAWLATRNNSLPNLADHLDDLANRLEAKRELPTSQADRIRHAAASLRAVSKTDAPPVLQAFERIIKGAGFTVADVASLTHDGAQAIIEASFAVGFFSATGFMAAGANMGKGLQEAAKADSATGPK